MVRVPIPPKVRWQVYTRDGFRCRYCGKQPPDAVLVVDHMHPVSRGGRNDRENLITACEECNQGKSATEMQPLPEMRHYQITALCAVQWLVDIWCDITGEEIDWMPNTDIYLDIIQYSATPDEAVDHISYFAYRAKDGDRSVEDILNQMWTTFHKPEIR